MKTQIEITNEDKKETFENFEDAKDFMQNLINDYFKKNE
jgi:hypothetical protein